MSFHGLSELEFQEYLKCIRNLKVGDVVEFYLCKASRDRPASPWLVVGVKPDCDDTAEMDVIGVSEYNNPAAATGHYNLKYRIPYICLAGIRSPWGWKREAWGLSKEGQLIDSFTETPKGSSFRFINMNMFVAAIHKSSI